VLLAWLLCSLGGCERNPAALDQRGASGLVAAPTPVSGGASIASAITRALPSASAASSAAPSLSASGGAYDWLDDPGYAGPAPADTLRSRWAAPAGFARVPLAAGSFGAWLRQLPLAAAGTPVRSYAGDVLYPASDSRIAAVIAIDAGSADLQQCADAVIRLHAEWRWSQGRRDHAYRAASGILLPFERFTRGERVVADGTRLRWRPAGRVGADYAAFRRYLDVVFTWANSVSLARQADEVSPDALQPGDFFALGGNPGHAVLVLDLARAVGGRRAALLGQSYMPAQNLHVLRPAAGRVWFSLEPSRDLSTPFWRPFPWSSLRRLPE
jgi:hypothetical protein